MSSRSLKVSTLLLASTALVTAAFPFAAQTAPNDGKLLMAQAAPPAPPAPAAEPDKDKKPAAPPQARPQPPAPPHAQSPAAQPHAQTPPSPPQSRAAEERRPAPAAQQERRDSQRQERQEERQDRRDERANERRAPQPSQAQPAPSQPAAPSTAQQPQRPNAPATAQERRDDRREQRGEDRREQRREGQRDERRDDRREGQREERRPQAPSTAQPQQAPQPAPSTAQQPQPRTAPSTAQQPPAPNAPATARQPAQPTAPSTAQQPQPNAPATAQQPQNAPAATTASPAAVAPPTQTRNANEFIRRDGQGPTRSITDIRQERRETREGDRTIIREPDRTIIREGDRTIIRHNEAGRFAIDARNVRTERRGANTETIIERGNGVRIVTVTDAEGRLVRRVRRDAGGRDVVIIDNSFAPRAGTVFVQLPPPVIRIPRQRYILEAERARPEEIYEVFMEPPVERIDERYTLEQVRYSAPLRDRMPRVDLDVTFDTGSWQLTPEQIDRLASIADGIKRAVQRNPREVFLVEGHTDAVGADVDNLSLSDRRAEAVAVALTEQFEVPPENLVTQGYGEQQLKVPTDGPERANRRVAVRRITPLIDQQAQNTGGR
jgi:outer membrane protein OmpA-like peptidoglycan-associated protein